MINIICTGAKYIIILLILVYTYQCFSILSYSDAQIKKRIIHWQNAVMYFFQLLAYGTLFLQLKEGKYLVFYVLQFVVIGLTMILYTIFYPRASRIVLNNMCMLISVGFVMLARLNYELAIKQLVVFSISMIVSLFIPWIIRKGQFLSKQSTGYVFAGIGILSLIAVVILGSTSYGAKLGFQFAGFSIQPSEFVKIIFVFFVAASLAQCTKFKHLVWITALAAAHVLILVLSTDLGAAVILFIVYLVMLYVATKKIRYMVTGIAAGAGASVLGYFLFSHVRVRVLAWRDPFSAFDSGGYQIAQSLFAIGTGGWLGMGLLKGLPTSIPVVSTDFIFAAIAEELGLIFALCVIMIYVSCYIMFLNIAMQMKNQFYKLVALGLGTAYIFQVFLTIGGVTKFIPSTGVTLPLISYGGSSLLSTLIMFAIIQGLYILREDEEKEIEKERVSIRRKRKA